MNMNNIAMEKLQYNELKEHVKSHCTSNLGKIMIDKLHPSSHMETVKKRLNETTEGKILLESSVVPLQGIVHIDNIISKLEKGMILNGEALSNVSSFLRGCRKLKAYMEDNKFYAPVLAGYSNSIEVLEHIEEEINTSIVNDKVSPDASKELKRITRLIENLEIKIENKLNDFLRSSTNKIYIQDFFITKRKEKFTIPIKSSYKNQVSGTVIEISGGGSTVFMEPATVSKYSSELEQLVAEKENEEYQILSFLTGLINDCIRDIKQNAEVVGIYDMIFAKSKFSREISGISPNVNNYGYINIINGRHPMLKHKVVPLNFTIGKDYRTLVITGPNAGGKTVVLKTVGLLTLAVQSGFHIPCESGSEFSVFENVFADIGDDQSIENALSTFSSHVKNIAQIIQDTNKSTLLLFDEIGSGTEPNEGAALAISVLEEVYHKGAITVSTTHYGEIKDYSLNHPDFENAAMLFNSETLEPLFKLIIGESGNSNAFWIAEKMGINKLVVQRAREYISNKEYNFNMISKNKVIQIKNDEINVDEEVINFDIGDRVYLTEYKESGIVYKPKDKFNNLTIFYKGEFKEINVKQLKLENKARELYPEGYDLNTLFVDFSELKLERDINRGSKKALKKINKKIKSRRNDI